jgi:hypothetical protein
MIRPAFLDVAETAAALLHEPMLIERWSTPSALPDFSTGGLARHLANQLTHTATLLAATPGASAISVLERHNQQTASWTSATGVCTSMTSY